MPDLYTFSSSAVPASAHVVGFRGTEAISQLYRFEIGLLLRDEQELDMAAAVGFKASLTINAPSGPLAYHGMIARVELLHSWAGQTLYRILLVPKVWFLTTSRHSWVWIDKDTPTILRAMLSKNNNMLPDDFELRLQRSYPAREFVCQYKESDFAFLARWMEREGIYFYFEHGDDKEKLIIADDKGAHTSSREDPARYVPSSAGDHMALEAFDGLAVIRSAIPSSVTENDFDYLKPMLDVWAETTSESGGGGAVFRHGENVQTPDQAQALADVRAQELGASETVTIGNGRVFQLRAGYKWSLDGHPRAALNGEYLAVRLEHQGNQSAGSDEVRRLLHLDYSDEYRVSVRAIASDVQFRPERSTPKPRIYGVERGFVDGPADSDYAQIDEHGRYKVLLHFDESMTETMAGANSSWIRMLQPHGGNPEGFHLPLRKATEVMVVFIGGDPDRPVISGAVPNTLNPSPVTKDNATQNVIQTGGKNRIEMEDQDGRQYIDISTPPKDTRIHLGEPHGGHSHYIVFNTEGTQLVNIGGNRDIEVGGKLTEHVKGHVSWTHDSGRKDVVTGDVKEQYSSLHDTLVTGTRVETVTGSVSETYASLNTKVGGAVTELFGTQSTTVSGGQSLVVGGSQTINVGGALTETASSVNQLYGSQTTTCGAWKGTFGSWNFAIPGGVKITAPSWKVTDPDQSWYTASSSHLGGAVNLACTKKIDVTAISASVSGMKIGVSLTASIKAGIKSRKAGVKEDTDGTDVKTSGVKTYLAGLFSIS